MLCFSFDIDWAPDKVVEHCISLLQDFGAKATFFATHDSAVLKGLDPGQFEVAIHPNFNSILQGSGETFQTPINNLMRIYPNSKGLRSHSLTQSSSILDYCSELGFSYETNQFFPFQVPAFRDYNHLVRIAINWADIHWLLTQMPFTYEVPHYNSAMPLVCTFHPVHIFLNTKSYEQYSNAKQFYQNPDELIKYRTEGAQGVENILVSALNYAKKKNIQTYQLKEIAENFGI